MTYSPPISQAVTPESAAPATASQSLIPPSHVLLETTPPAYSEDGMLLRIMETDVGISEYIAKNTPQIGGIIKQRFTDFLVYEVDQDSNVTHIKSLAMPTSEKKAQPADESTTSVEADHAAATTTVESATAAESIEVKTEPDSAAPETLEATDLPAASSEAPKESEATAIKTEVKEEDTEPWPESFTTRLSTFLSEDKIAAVKKMFLEGHEPPFVSDAGWGSRPAKAEDGADEAKPEAPTEPEEPAAEDKRGGRGGRGGRGRGRGRGRGGRGGGADRPGKREDTRKVVSDPMADKTTRTEFHKAIRELFGGKLDSETDTTSTADDDGSRIVVKWSRSAGRGGGRGGGGRGGRGGGARGSGDKAPRGTYPPFIHFTMQKTNRDTQDALIHLSRSLHVNVKDLSVAGTKDKRGVTVQRVALRRGNKSVEDVWRLANGVPSRRTAEEAVKERGERGVRVADFNYRKAALELGMLKGNAFVITLRNVQVDSEEALAQAMDSIKTKGFINYYGMQRFGTAAIPTHTIGLAFLKSDWQGAVNLILRERPGEHPDVVAARKAWLEEKNLDKALALLPRRVVAERCILESYRTQKGETRNALGALSTIPRNLRLMYVHAYQSYVWNAIVSERIKTYGHEKPIPGDLVLEASKQGGGDAMDVDEGAEEEEGKTSAGRRKWIAPKVKTLTAEDCEKYSIFDVVMPLPGKDVAFPGGALGEKYREYLRRDGLDPDNFHRRQKEYSLSGSYRSILHLPRELSYEVLRYTDPDVSLAQADEDKLLGYDPPVVTPDGKFMALQIRLTLGTAAYATMALREVTKTDTSSHFQTSLTQNSEDQQYKGGNVASGADTGDVKEEGAEGDVIMEPET
ncbi:tRNA pseudouridine synthase D [Peniophora sp. CONT]|nr:tRNA pseudouridine synthase D [Peniophora sp. CONT]